MFMQNFWATNKEHYGMLGYLLVCTWRHGGHVGGQEQKHFSPLWTKLYFQINSSRKTIYCVDLQRGCPVTWLQFSITRATGFPDVVCVKYRVFSHDVTAAILVSQNNKGAAMPKPGLRELNSFLMQTQSFVPINLHICWPREWKHSILIYRMSRWNSHKLK